MNVALDITGVARFRESVARAMGLVFDDSKIGFLNDVLRRRMAATGKSQDAYLAVLDGGSDREEIARLAEELTVGETYFFRNNEQFRAFTEVVLPDRMRARQPASVLRFLSAGCSSGEEAFTIAIATRETVPTPPWRTEIRAFDINPAALRKAEAGAFTDWALRETPASVREHWFTQRGRELILADEIRAAVRFDRRNLCDEDADLWAPGTYDAIFCRNVTMYLTPARARAVIQRIARALAPGGYLFLGHAETLRGMSTDFHLLNTHGTFYYRRKLAGEDGYVPEYVPRAVAATPAADVGSPPAMIDTRWYDEIGKASQRIAALKTQPPTALTPTAEAGPSLGIALELLQKERYGDALDLMRDLPASAGTDPDALLLRAILLIHGGQLVAASEACSLLLAADETNAAANYVLGLACEGAADTEAALAYYRRAAHLDAGFAMPRLHAGLIARRAGDFKAARSELNLALGLLEREEPARLLLFGGGFTRAALIALCRAELQACGAK